MKKSERIAALELENSELKQKLAKYEIEEKLTNLLNECRVMSHLVELTMNADAVVNSDVNEVIRQWIESEPGRRI